jgi:hypothetical protein
MHLLQASSLHSGSLSTQPLMSHAQRLQLGPSPLPGYKNAWVVRIPADTASAAAHLAALSALATAGPQQAAHACRSPSCLCKVCGVLEPDTLMIHTARHQLHTAWPYNPHHPAPAASELASWKKAQHPARQWPTPAPRVQVTPLGSGTCQPASVHIPRHTKILTRPSATSVAHAAHTHLITTLNSSWLQPQMPQQHTPGSSPLSLYEHACMHVCKRASKHADAALLLASIHLHGQSSPHGE